MATERLIIEVTEKGARVVSREIAGIGKTATAAESGVTLLRRALGALGAAATVRGLVRTADAFTQIQNRLRLVTDGTAELNAVTQELLAISNETRSSLQSNAELFNRLALSTRELGTTQQDVLDFTKSLNQAVILSGASAQEASAGLIQLSQGLASGALRGDELRSVLEQLPVVADVISKELGVTRGQLRELGAEGKITADIVLNAFKSAADELQENFGKTIPTVAQAFQILRNNFIAFVGDVNNSVGATRALSQLIIELANNMELLGQAAAAAAFAIGTLLARRALTAAIAGVRALSAAILANPLGALATAALLATSALVGFSNEIAVSADGIVTLGDTAKATFEFLRDGSVAVANQLQEAFAPAITGINKALSTIGLTFDDVLDLARDFANKFVGLFVGVGRAVGAAIASARDGFTDFGANVKEAFTSGFEADFVQDAIDFIAPAVEEISVRAREIALERIQGAQQAQQQLEAARAGLGAGAGGAAPAAVDTDFQQVLADLDRQAEILKLTNRERAVQNDLLQVETSLKRELTPTEEALVQARLENLQALQQQADLLDEIRQPAQDFEDRISALNQLLSDGKITLEEFNLKLMELRQGQLELDQTFGSGLERGLLRVSDAANTLGDSVETFVVGGFNKATDALTNFATTGKLDFKGLVSSILSDLAKLAAQQAIAGLVGGLLPGGAGAGAGAGGFLSGLLGFQNGGGFQVGGSGGADSQTVAFNATPGETVGVMTPQQMASMNQPVVVPPPTVQVINVSDPSEIPNGMDSPAGDEVLFNFVDRNSEAIRRRLS